MTDSERLRGEEEREGRQRGGEEPRWSVLSLASPAGRVSTRLGRCRAQVLRDGGADGDRMGAGVSALSGKKR